MTDQRQNVIFLLCDDLSWGDLGVYGQEKIETPNLDALASAGMRFRAAYAGAPVCAPSRSCLMQGKHLGHATVRENMVWTPSDAPDRDGNLYRHCLADDDVTVAHQFKQAGYATGMFGKWGLALSDQTGLPNDMGFDEFFGYLNQRRAHNYYPPYLWHNTRRVDLPENEGHRHRDTHEYDAHGDHLVNGVPDPKAASYSFDLCHARAMDFVRRHADQPFFLYLPVTIPHGVHEVPNLLQYRDRDWPLAMKVYAAMVTRLDNAVGELVDLLKARGIFDNTLLVFASDNGYSFRDQGDEQTTLAEFFDHAGPFKGAKGNLHQGGVRVPAFAHWPGRIEPGTVNDTPWAFCDWLPTACDLLDRPVPDGVDGVSMLPTWTGRTDEQADRELLYWEFRDEQAARLGPWWVRRDDPTRPVEVYHADDDPAETTDRAAELPDVVARAEAIFASQHAPSDYFPDPGESQESWWDRLRANGLTPAHNVMG